MDAKSEIALAQLAEQGDEDAKRKIEDWAISKIAQARGVRGFIKQIESSFFLC